jgi:hypothetical protein
VRAGACQFRSPSTPLQPDQTRRRGKHFAATAAAPHHGPRLLATRSGRARTPKRFRTHPGFSAICQINDKHDRRRATRNRHSHRTTPPCHHATMSPRHHATPAQVSLAWLLQRVEVGAVVVGASTPEQAVSNAAAVDIVLTSSEQRDVGDAFAQVRVVDAGSAGTRARRLLKRKPRKLAPG